jgi:hypothetical protein
MRPVERLRGWAANYGGSLTFTDHGDSAGDERWTLTADRPVPMRLAFQAAAASVDGAAIKIIELLEEVGENIPTE